MKTAILSTGNELIQGTISDTNSAWMARRLAENGIEVNQIVVIGDSQSALEATLHAMWRNNDLVICTGGLGPTTDDITAKAVAHALKVPQVRHAEATEQIIARFAERNFPMAPINMKQADLPKGCQALENPSGTAPGFRVDVNNCKTVFLPGVPSEMKVMFKKHILPLLEGNGTPRHVVRCHLFGIGESVLQEKLLPVEKAFPEVAFSYRAAFPVMSITLSGNAAEKVIEAQRNAQTLLAPWIYATTDKSLSEVVGDMLRDRQLTIASAESCTGGMIAHELTNVAGSSDYVQGAVVAYDNRIKNKVLAVPADLLNKYGAVSEQVVRSMVLGVQQLMNTHVAVATSGIAGPGGGSDEKPVGTVHIAVAIKDVIFHKKCLFKGYSRTKVKTATTWTALQMVRSHLMDMPLLEKK
ncbi:MAG: competence/damage-inducible protein A [Deltaproteobacteria bacterium]|nr:competence/damage-inducible protein A [Deltaproteobacteria bacterium]